MRRLFLALVGAVALARSAMAMEVDAWALSNPFDGTHHESTGALFYRDGSNSLVVRIYAHYNNEERFKTMIAGCTTWFYSVARWKDQLRRGVTTLDRELSQGVITQRTDFRTIYHNWGLNGYVRTVAEKTTVNAAIDVGMLVGPVTAAVAIALRPGPLCDQVGLGPEYCTVALSFAGVVAKCSGLITLDLTPLNMPACHWGYFTILAALLGLYAYTKGWQPWRNKLGLFVVMMVTRILLAYFMGVVVADFQFLQGLSNFVYPDLENTDFYYDDKKPDVPPPLPGDGIDLGDATEFEGTADQFALAEIDLPDEAPSGAGEIQQNMVGAPTSHSCFRDRWEGVYERTIIAAIAAAALSGGVFAAGTYAGEYQWVVGKISSPLWSFVAGWLLVDYFTHQGLSLWADEIFQKIKKLMNDGLDVPEGSIQGKPALMVRCRSPRVVVEEHPIMFLSDICKPFQLVFPKSLKRTAASFLLALSLPLGMLCCYWYAMRWEWDGSLPPSVFTVQGCAAPGDRRFGPDFSMDAPISKHIIAWLWQFFRWMWCDWPSLGLGMPVSFAIYDIRGDTAYLVKGSAALRPGSTNAAIPDWPATLKVFDQIDDAYRDETSPAALNITALRINKPTAAEVVAGLRALV